MKKILAIIGVAALLATVPTINSSAQVPTDGSTKIALPNVPAATTTNLANPVLLDFSHQGNAPMQFNDAWSTAGESTGQTNAVYTLAPTLDGITYATNSFSIVTITAGNYSGTVGYYNLYQTNLTARTKGWFITSIKNNSAGGVLTNSVTCEYKISAP